VYRLVDLGDENITELMSSDEIAALLEQKANTEEAAVDTIEKMAENATDKKIVSDFSITIFRFLLIN